MKEIFDNYIENAFHDYQQADFKIRQFENNYKKFFPLNLTANMLDIGIGCGEMLTCMKNWGYTNYLGIDISPSTVNFCKSLGLNCTLVDNSVMWLSDKDSVFDIITLLDVLEHFQKEDVIPFLKNLYAALKPEGKLIIQVPNLQAPDGYLHRYNDFTHNIGFLEHSLEQALLAAGINKSKYYGFEEIVDFTLRSRIRKVIRYIYWKYCKFIRRINTNLNPGILNPVFFAIIRKEVY